MNKLYSKILTAIMLSLFLAGTYGCASETDKGIVSSANQSYVFKTYLDKDSITVKSEKGMVTLTGTVLELSHKSLAEETVSNLPDVKKVTNRLEFNGTPLTIYSDEWIALQIKTSLLFNRHVSGINTQVTVVNGVVTLEGDAENQVQKDLTAEYAKDVKGVKEIKNELTVPNVPNQLMEQAEEVIDDASITAQVKIALLSHYSTSALMTGVSTTNGVVTLSGDVNNAAEKDMATKVTADVKGVNKVINNMSIKTLVSKK